MSRCDVANRRASALDLFSHNARLVGSVGWFNFQGKRALYEPSASQLIHVFWYSSSTIRSVTSQLCHPLCVCFVILSVASCVIPSVISVCHPLVSSTLLPAVSSPLLPAVSSALSPAESSLLLPSVSPTLLPVGSRVNGVAIAWWMV